MKVADLRIVGLFEGHVFYKVPLYQRPYVWNEEKHWQPLWDDIKRMAAALMDGDDSRVHFLGASVQQRETRPAGSIETKLVIDGQQRLTTLQIFLKAFADLIKDIEDQIYPGKIYELIKNDAEKFKTPSEHFKVFPTNADQKYFSLIMECKDIGQLDAKCDHKLESLSKPYKMLGAYVFFHNAIKDWLAESDDAGKKKKIESLYHALRDHVRVVVIDIDEKDDAHLIFETLNARGEPLLAIDLVKNSLLSELQDRDKDIDIKEAYNTYWKQFDEDQGFWRQPVGRGEHRKALAEHYLRDVLTLLTSEEVPANYIYRAYSKYKDDSNAGTPLERLQKFHKFGLIYEKMQKGYENERIQLFLDNLRAMDVGVAYPFLLKLFDKMKSQAGYLVPVLVDIESFLVRRMVCRLTPKAYNMFFRKILNTLDVEPEKIHESVREKLKSGKGETDRWPDEDEFKEAWINTPLYGKLNPARLRVILESLERQSQGQFSEYDNITKKLSIEHIMPQGWRGIWSLPVPVGENPFEAEVRRNDILQTIGNLTLLDSKLNSKQQNSLWIDPYDDSEGKRAALQEHSRLDLNIALCKDYPHKWDEETIRDRSEKLFEKALEIWGRPE